MDRRRLDERREMRVSRSSVLVIALVWMGLLWVGRDRPPDTVWIFLVVVPAGWVARAVAEALERVDEPTMWPAEPVTVYIDDWGDRPEEVVQEVRRRGGDLHPRILERTGPTRVAVAVRVSQDTASALADTLRGMGAGVSLHRR